MAAVLLPGPSSKVRATVSRYLTPASPARDGFVRVLCHQCQRLPPAGSPILHVLELTTVLVIDRPSRSLG